MDPINKTNYYHLYIKYKAKYMGLKNSKHHSISIRDPWFTYIKTGKKTVEGRLNTGIFAGIKQGDTVEWYIVDTDQKVNTYVTFVHKYESFEQMIQTETLESVLPGIDTLADGVAVYDRIYREKIKGIDGKYKIIAIGVKVIDDDN